ncbi:thermonuclease family protein [Paracoccus sp. MKU1]|uniref:thermonuclease family protein n=1 Tax=Paracoccus sp. MKU1 TaxID=1745182 RepID=UPI00071932BB|nr:hypothetical protein [Paracoccus sp. MKU1]KRW97556.1 hypothetical protein AQY21_03035 [Paracoccus sp. MKU1]
MLNHIVVSVLLCAASCEPAEIRVWDGDSVQLGLGREAEAMRIVNIDALEIRGQCAQKSDLALQSKQRLADLLQAKAPTIMAGPWRRSASKVTMSATFSSAKGWREMRTRVQFG